MKMLGNNNHKDADDDDKRLQQQHPPPPHHHHPHNPHHHHNNNNNINSSVNNNLIADMDRYHHPHPHPHPHPPHLHPHHPSSLQYEGGDVSLPLQTDPNDTLDNNNTLHMDDPNHPHPHHHHPPHPPHPQHHHPIHGSISSPPDVSEPGVCAGCGSHITERYYLLAVDKQWHATCLKCSCCQLNLDAELTCFAKDGEIFCKEDYYRKFAVKTCARCQMGISAQELVMRARNCVYHLNCFSCAVCNKMLSTGEHFGMKGDLIFCKVHYELVLQEDEMANDPHSHLNQQPLPFYSAPPQKGRPRKRKQQVQDQHHMDHMLVQHMHGMDGDDHSLMGDAYNLQSPRQKRIRTSFKHHQLRILKSYFALNQNPDAKDLKQLSSKTGLSKRVLQVWFQNARAKYRRNILKEPGGGGSTNGDNKPSQGQTDSPSSGHDSNQNTLLEFSREDSSPPLTDMSSTPSLADYGGHGGQGGGGLGGMHDHCQSPPMSSLSDLFNSSMNHMN